MTHFPKGSDYCALMRPHIARIEVSPEYLAKALHLPEGTEIFASMVERGHAGYTVVLGVEHPDLPAVDEGAEAPLISPTITYHRESWDFDWNVPQVEFQVTYGEPEVEVDGEDDGATASG